MMKILPRFGMMQADYESNHLINKKTKEPYEIM